MRMRLLAAKASESEAVGYMCAWQDSRSLLYRSTTTRPGTPHRRVGAAVKENLVGFFVQVVWLSDFVSKVPAIPFSAAGGKKAVSEALQKKETVFGRQQVVFKTLRFALKEASCFL
uniref:Uncharacterized protein n=1 Tax=Chromera velia CCMP2878 TaxID=1169474 RepID=A0A0G4HEI4_9ALVE|eukprot:Cvel_6560.t1-p1 / transcript=Cvel_6560.t1 / gene=Cvel_6560 / organism=Chromera_velia_CCMP2878 / gene_product=hypothetical protein / transcript_product=hypothetical protein / location=Cvel_scaffold323:40270-46042(+) / protein_length=115 / sequence_SO=supercontig / SO=protein_coding / is_pseudo=false